MIIKHQPQLNLKLLLSNQSMKKSEKVPSQGRSANTGDNNPIEGEVGMNNNNNNNETIY